MYGHTMVFYNPHSAETPLNVIDLLTHWIETKKYDQKCQLQAGQGHPFASYVVEIVEPQRDGWIPHFWTDCNTFKIRMCSNEDGSKPYPPGEHQNSW